MAIRSISRRDFVAAAGLAAVGAMAALTGCGGSGSGSDSGSNAGSSAKQGRTEEEIRAEWASFPTTPLKLYDEAPASEEEMPTITPQELMELMESGEQYALVDVNSPSMYKDGHIDGAVNLPWDINGFKQDPELPRGVKMVFYCVCAAEEDSMHMGYSAVKDYAYRNIVLLKGGTPAWQEAGGELVK